MALNDDTTSDSLMVAAIDFGTTYSGYAFSMKDDYETDKLKISSNQWKSPTMISLKTPTTVLLGPDKKLVAFGYDAESQYTALAEQDKHKGHYYFRRFKMVLYNEIRTAKLTRKTTIPDIHGKRLPAIDIFAHAIGFLQQHLLDQLNSRGTGIIHQQEIHWVITVPAIWDDPAKQFMREAAKKANIHGENLTIALEPEAASIYCKHLSLEKGEEDEGFSVFQEGSRYLVLDAGGGTVDITLHEIQKDGRIRELEQATGGPWGGTFVDEAFYSVLSDVLGREEFERYRRDHASDMMEIYREFELKKRSLERTPEEAKTESTSIRNITMKIPVTLKDFCKEIHKKTIQDVTKEKSNCDGLIWQLDKLRISHERFSDMFSVACDGIVNHIKKLLTSSKAKGTNKILMVGGFSESLFLQEKIRKSFPDMHVVVPHEAGLAVLKGAVLYGHDPKAISVRVARCTYGVGTCALFNPSYHPQSRRTKIKNEWYCRGVFSRHVKKGDVLEVDEAQEDHPYVPLHDYQTGISFKIYTSTEDNPMFTDDESCRYLGCLEIDISKLKRSSKKSVRVKFIFGGTEIKVVGRIEETNEETEVTFNFLEENPDITDKDEVYLDY
ncbi:heat shock 70 kDa protein 12B-like [Saccostrea echinata]|uniref:heat shock 70 kDa protein 12B-like n=1 Tax=Saccostrea echinata TaxID=191078 RepID=UPI002A80EFBF|nr:heat shock 70 kDa protein 12B-like [Saccostrea echinata]